MSYWLRAWCPRCCGSGVIYRGSSTTLTESCRTCEGIGFFYIPKVMVFR